MAKSLGNTFTISDLKKHKIHPLSFRYWLLTGRYNTPMNFTWEAVRGAQVALEKIVNEYLELPEVLEVSRTRLDINPIDKFEEAIADNLNTPVAISLLQKAKSRQEIDEMDKVLGLNIKKLSEMMKEIPAEISNLQKERDLARENKDFAKSDSLRLKIESLGFRVNDSSSKTLILKGISALI
jgi:cysteinyl-tRNA synthetase